MSEQSEEPAKKSETQDISRIAFSEFLEGTAPSQSVPISSLLKKDDLGRLSLERPELQLYCPSDICNGPRIFRSSDREVFIGSKKGDRGSVYLSYICSNCRQAQKIYSLFVTADDGLDGNCYKFGEYPPFGPPTPTRLLRLFGRDRELFLSGRRCENQGLGIGAFVYYRRVVESHRQQIFDEIIKVSEKIGASNAMLETLRAARGEVQFSKALESVKDAIPQALLLNGHNPLTLLHTALSAGLHEKSDEKCLELAQDIRVVLAELADRLGQLLKDEAELNTAVSRLLQARSRGNGPA